MDLFFPRECLLRNIFPGEGLLIFSWGRPFEIYFFLEKGLRDFFFSISSGPPQIINGRPLKTETQKVLGQVFRSNDLAARVLRNIRMDGQTAQPLGPFLTQMQKEIDWQNESYHCFAKAVHSRAKLRTANSPSVCLSLWSRLCDSLICPSVFRTTTHVTIPQ